MKIEFDQICALVVIVGGFTLRFCGIDGEVWAVVLIASGFLFGSGYQARRKIAPGKHPPASEPSG